MKKFLTFFLLTLLAFSVGWAATVQDVLNQTFTGVSGTSYTNFSGKTGTSGAVYAGNCAGSNSSIQLRSNNNNSGIVTTSSGGKARKVTVVWNSNTQAGRTLNVYGKNSAYSAATDLYNSNDSGTLLGTIVYGTSTTLSISGDYEYIGFRSASGALYLTSVTIDWETGGGTTVAAPTISPNGGNFVGSQEVTLSHADGGTIYYTLNGDDPTESSTLYIAPFTIDTTTTVKAIAVKDGVSSTVASATFNNIGVATISEAYAVAQDSQFIFTGNAVVTYQNGRYVWIRDNSGSGLIFRAYNDQGTLNNGDILDAGWSATNTIYNSIPEFSNPTGVASSHNDGTVAPFDKTSTGVTSANVNEYVSFSNITLSWDSSLGYNYVTINNKKVYFSNQFFNYNSTGLTVTSGNTYYIEGIAYERSGNVFVYMTKVTAVSPILTAIPDALTIDDSGSGNTFNVEGSNLGTDNVGLTQTNNNFTPTLTATTGDTYDGVYNGSPYCGFTPADGSLNGTVAMSYTGRELSASTTVTLGNNTGASATVTVNYVADLYIVTDNGVTNDWHFDGTYGVHMTNNAGIYTATFTAENPNTFILFARKLGDGVTWNTRYVFGPSSGGDWVLPASGNGNGTIDLNTSHPIKIQGAGTYIVTINANDNTFTIKKEVVNEGDFVLVTNVNQLNAGDEIIFVSSSTAGDNDAKAMSTTQNSNNRGVTTVAVSATQKVTATDETQIFTLEGNSSGWYFKTVNGETQGYIYAASSSNNYLRTEATADANGNAKAAISVASDGLATIVFQGNYTRNNLRYNPSNNPPVYSCYVSTSSMAKPYIYKRSASAEPSITVAPTSLSFVNPVDGTPQSQNVTVTESNTTGTTIVSITGTGAASYSATLENGTLTVTYSGSATQANPDVATITLTNGGATATVEVTGYKLPVVLTITPADGHTFQGSTVTGIIESNVAGATIEYSVDGTTWQTYDPDEGFTATVNEVGGTVTVYARATYNGETATTQVTYTRVAQTSTCTADIVFAPTSNNGGVAQWTTLKTHISEGSDYVSSADMAAIFTSQDYASMRFGSGSNVGNLALTLDLSKFETGACKLTKVIINAARYSNDSGCELKVSTNVNTTGVTQAITANQTDFADYVFGFDGSEITTLSIENLANGKRVYVHSITLEYNCEISLTLAGLVEAGEVNKIYTISDPLIAAAVTWDADQEKFAIFAKDNKMYADKQYPTGDMKEYLIKFVNQDSTFTNTVEQKDYDQSNWIEILIPSEVSNITSKSADPNAYQSKLDQLKETYENQILSAGTLKGTYVDAFNPTMSVVDNMMPDVETSSTYTPNIYCTANFLWENLDTDGATSYRDDQYGGQYFMMDAKPNEFCKVVWAYYQHMDDYFVAPAQEGDTINGHNFHGSFLADMSLCEDNWVVEKSPLNYFNPSDATTPEKLYGFRAIVRKNPESPVWASKNGAPHRIQPSTESPKEQNPAYIVYPLNSETSSTDNVTAVTEVKYGMEVVSVRYYNIMGMESETPFEGINIMVTRYSDGSTTSCKVLR